MMWHARAEEEQMEVQVTHRHDCWDDAMESHVDGEVERLRHRLELVGVGPASLHIAVTAGGHEHTECSARLHLPGMVLLARESSIAMEEAVQRAIDELIRQIYRHERIGINAFAERPMRPAASRDT